MSKPAAPKVVLFDWDNTLVDSWACIHEAMNRTLIAMDHAPWGFEEMKDRVALSLRDSFPALFKERWTEARDIFYDSFAAIHLDYLKPLPNVAEMLPALQEMGLRLGVVSNKNGNFLRQEVAHLGWGALFDGVVGATDAKADKPDRAAIDLALSSTGIKAGPEVWLAGDAEVDMEGAIGAGCIAVLLRSEPQRPNEFKRFQPDLRFASCSDFHGALCELLIPM